MSCLFLVLCGNATNEYLVIVVLQFIDFVASHPPSNESQRNLFVQMQLLIQQNIDWITENAADIDQWLATQVPREFAETHHLAAPLPVSPFAYLYQSIPEDY
jgi:hypothetical protein